MKRPMCFISIVLSVFLIFLLTIVPPSVYNDSTSLKQAIRIEGSIKDKYSKNGFLFLSIVNAGLITGNIPSKEKNDILVKLNEGQQDFEALPDIGTVCVIEGKKLLFSRGSNPGQFDTGFYEMVQGFDYELYDAGIISTGASGDAAALIAEKLCRLRYRWGRVYDALFCEDDAGVVRSMVLGDRNALNGEIKGLYQRAGISHALCISGLHISLLGYGLYGMLKRFRLPQAPAGIISLIIMVLYGMMVGMGISTVRALIMFAMVLTAEMTGRSYDILSSLSLSGTVILLAKPLCIYDTGFMLSFGAVLGIGIAGPALQALFPFRSAVTDSLKTSISVNLFTFPITLWFFYQFPVYSVILNIILIPLMGLLLTLAFVTGIAGMLFLPAGRLPAFICHMILSLYRGGCSINDRMPYSIYVAGRPAVWKIVIYYVILTAAVLIITYGAKKPEKSETRAFRPALRNAAACVMMLLAAVMLMIHVRLPFTMTVVDVGQGDCIFFQTGDGTSFLTDCGSSDVKQAAKYRVVPFLKANGTGRIDYAFITHTDDDHVNGFEELLSESEAEGMPIGSLIMPDIGNRDEKYIQLEKMARKRGVRVMHIGSGDRMIKNGLVISCLHPEKKEAYGDINEGSAVLDLKYGEFTALLTGDIQGKGEEEMTAHVKHGYTVLKCAHHGSENSTPMEFLNRIKPRLTLISCGAGNKYGHPHAALIKRLEECGTDIVVTSTSGAITIKTDGKNVTLEKYIKERDNE